MQFTVSWQDGPDLASVVLPRPRTAEMMLPRFFLFPPSADYLLCPGASRNPPPGYLSR